MPKPVPVPVPVPMRRGFADETAGVSACVSCSARRCRSKTRFRARRGSNKPRRFAPFDGEIARHGERRHIASSHCRRARIGYRFGHRSHQHELPAAADSGLKKPLDRCDREHTIRRSIGGDARRLHVTASSTSPRRQLPYAASANAAATANGAITRRGRTGSRDHVDRLSRCTAERADLS
ncbi:hypothetical protein [Burkholderia savannae]|uniref:hypothetical protein n=1 Tax=Burkholderia savannae TaxID=1637837 RepID=UPI0012F5250E|nr:hypothetical protein [Burkholderia savannae]